MKRRRVLVSAFAFAPGVGSEPAVGWNIATRLAAYHDITVFYGDMSPSRHWHRRVEEHVRRNGKPDGLETEFVEAPPAAKVLHALHRFPPLLYLYWQAYEIWQRRLFQLAMERHRARPFEIVHQLNYISFRKPGRLWKMPVPFVWGPVTGTFCIPTPVLLSLGWRGLARMGVRNVLNPLHARHSRNVREAARQARHLWVVTPEDARVARTCWGVESEPMLETAADNSLAGRVRERTPGAPLWMVWSGMHIALKAMPFLLRAWSTLSEPARFRLRALGAGPETDGWKRLASRLGLSDWIDWTGQLPRNEAVRRMEQADVLFLTSVKEGTPHVVLEALALGLPVVCHDACGMSVAVDDTCGIRVPLATPAGSIRGFADAMERLERDAGLLPSLSRGALERVKTLGWDAKAKRIADVYDRVAEESGKKGNGAWQTTT